MIIIAELESANIMSARKAVLKEELLLAEKIKNYLLGAGFLCEVEVE